MIYKTENQEYTIVSTCSFSLIRETAWALNMQVFFVFPINILCFRLVNLILETQSIKKVN